MQQFAARAYGPTWAAGLSYMQGGEGNYYGHNAILRIAPFREHCQLPVLPGKAPLGGHILSHDFVEAALMRRAGFKVYLAAELDGSFEEPPPTLIDYAVRDRRWCQGNLQHARLLAMPGLHPISRLHLLLGVMNYVASPLWMLLLLLSTIEVLRWKLGEHVYFEPGGSLFPVWEVSIATQATVLYASVLVLLFLPRILGLITRLRDRQERAHFGGGARLFASGMAECGFSMLLAPLMAVAQSQAILSIIRGRSTRWAGQTRGDRGTSLREAVKRHMGVTALGIAWTWILLRFSTELFVWMSPVLAGMTLSIPLSIWSSRVSIGEWVRRLGLLWTPEEVAPPALLRQFRQEVARGVHVDDFDGRSALERVLDDRSARQAHLALVRPRRGDPLEEHALQGLVLKYRLRGASSLSDHEERTLLLAPHAILALLETRDAKGSLGPSLALNVKGR
jgi:membrane glycosyltransferase